MRHLTRTQVKKDFLKAELQSISERIAYKELNIKEFKLSEKRKIQKLLKKRNKIEKELLELQ